MTVPPRLLDSVLVCLSRLVMRCVILRLGHLCVKYYSIKPRTKNKKKEREVANLRRIDLLG